MERLNWNLARELSKRAMVRIIGPAGARKTAPDGVTVHEIPLNPLAAFMSLSALRTILVILRWRPDWIIAGSGLVAPIAWISARLCGAKSAGYLHGLDIIVPNTIYRWIWLPVIRRLDTFFLNSRATRQLALDAGFPPRRLHLLFPGVDVSHRSLPSSNDFRDRHRIPEGPVLISVGRLTRRKGLREFIADVLPTILARSPTATLVVIGDEPSNALHGEAESIDSLKKVAAAAGMLANVRFMGRVSEVELIAAYRASDVHVFPLLPREGDFEGFGMVAVEAAAHGVPTVAYQCGGVADAVAEGVSGYLVPPGNHREFASKLLQAIEKPLEKSTIRRFASRFDWANFGDKAAEVLNLPRQEEA